MTPSDPDQAYHTIAGFFAELRGQGVVHVVVSPGSRSTPLTLVADAITDITCHVMIDERSAGFFARLGLARATASPVALVCTSGTAAANYLPAVVEAHHSRVPLVVCTADRPPELRQRGAGQTIDQVGLYGSHTRWFDDLPVASDVDADFGRRVGARAVAAATGAHPGPVHLNWPLREPLTPVTWRPELGEVPHAAVAIDRPRPGDPALAPAGAVRRGLIVVGPGDLAHAGEAVARLAEATGWPVLAEATSSLRTGPHVIGRPFLTHWDLLLRDPHWGADHEPEVVLRFGGAPTSKALRLWLERHRPPLIIVDPAAGFEDPSALVGRVVAAPIDAVVESLSKGGGGPSDWTRRWEGADRELRGAVQANLAHGPLLEAGIVAALAPSLPTDGALVVSNSMPVRDVDGFLPVNGQPLRVLANRGASGIDGVTSTALGVAASGMPTVLLTGDVAFTHDIGGLFAGVRAGLDLVIVVVDNGGGGIFEFLPVAGRTDVDFERLFLTPSALDWTGLGALAGVTVHRAATGPDLATIVNRALTEPGIDVIRVPVNRAANVTQHAELAALVAGLAR